jgi:hypothetical protein
MFEDRQDHMVATLAEMHDRARVKGNFDRNKAKEIMTGWVRQDRRFDSYDANRLIDRVQERSGNGGVLDLSDPYLRGAPKDDRRGMRFGQGSGSGFTR